MVVLFRPQIEELLIERDRVILQWQADHADTNVFEDRRLEVASSLNIFVQSNRMGWIVSSIEASGHVQENHRQAQRKA
jgi:hypothetical protein